MWVLSWDTSVLLMQAVYPPATEVIGARGSVGVREVIRKRFVREELLETKRLLDGLVPLGRQ